MQLQSCNTCCIQCYNINTLTTTWTHTHTSMLLGTSRQTDIWIYRAAITIICIKNGLKKVKSSHSKGRRKFKLFAEISQLHFVKTKKNFSENDGRGGGAHKISIFTPFIPKLVFKYVFVSIWTIHLSPLLGIAPKTWLERAKLLVYF